MAERALQKCENVTFAVYTVKTGQTVTRGMPVELSGGYLQEATAATDNAIGIAFDSENYPGTAAAAGHKVTVALFGAGVVPALVGTNGATAGSYQKIESDGVTDMTVGGGTGNVNCVGQALESSSAAGDLIGINLGQAGPSVGS